MNLSKNVVAASRQSAANLMLLREECGALPRRRYDRARCRRRLVGSSFVQFASLMLAAGPLTAHAELAILPAAPLPAVFAGEARQVQVIFRNPGNEPTKVDLHTRLYQTTAATAVLVREGAWKPLQVLPGQTVSEIATLDFPAVRAETRFLVHWLENTNNIIGKTEILVYPTNLLNDLKPLAGEGPIGLLDPQNQLKPLLNKLDLDFVDLEDAGLGSFTGKLAIVGPFKSRQQVPEGLADRIAALARKGGALVWIQPPPERERKLTPTLYIVPLGKGAVVVAQAQLVSDLADDPSAQLNLIHLAEYAVRHEPPRLPEQTR